MSGTVTGLDIDRLDEWVAGYRKLMLGGLGAEVHTAGVFAGRDDQPYITVDDVASLLAAARAVQRVEALHRRWVTRHKPGDVLSAELATDALAAALGTEQEGPE